jgi:hypothetical protein
MTTTNPLAKKGKGQLSKPPNRSLLMDCYVRVVVSLISIISNSISADGL